jgi:predicted secreted acid phosphatase
MSDAYWKGWLNNTSEYSKDLIWAYNVGKSVLDKYKVKNTSKPKCVVFDIDDTLVFGDPESLVGVREMELGEMDGQEIFILPRNEPIVKLAEYAKANKFVIVILTARPKTSRLASQKNLDMLRIPYDAIIMNDGDDDPCFKVGVRRRIANKYEVCMTVGDQITDCLSPGMNTSFLKLPDPTSKASYAYIPPNL